MLSFCFGVSISQLTTLNSRHDTTINRFLPTYLPSYLPSFLPSYLLTTDYLLLTTLKRSTDRITPFHAIYLRFNGLYRPEAPYIPPKRTAQPFQIIFYIFPSVSKKFFLKKIAYCLLSYIHRYFMLILYPYQYLVPRLMSCK